MQEAGQKPSAEDGALALVRGYAEHDPTAVAETLAALDPSGRAIAYGVLGGLLQFTLSIVEIGDRDIRICRLLRLADSIAPAVPPSYGPAVAEAVRAWARDDQAAVRQVTGTDPACALHVSAVFVAALGLALWGRASFLNVLTEYEQVLTDPPTGQRPAP
ncbi:hypothetical protein [Streptomyces albireticuli]|uniref:Uncharacterized protein n=1 Tax=Streptomyces albireticuli TaxID=1940 RepID=A0A2A2D6D4_9ACTN|nr:hypothetical protein [Streptomyces albireticuli]MCD9195159.1 hypothetical protein [Streptomyces albireticuli]PAU47085.1 hypothetical protein CK936_20700 [Streptomyces albireticuli]